MEIGSSQAMDTSNLNESYTSQLENLLQFHLQEMATTSSESSMPSAQTSPGLEDEQKPEIQQQVQPKREECVDEEEEEDQPSTSTANMNLMKALIAASQQQQTQNINAAALPEIDLSKLFQQSLIPDSNASVLSTILSQQQQQQASSSSSKPSTSSGTKNGAAPKAEKVYKPRMARMKVFAEGFFMTFDKESSCGLKNFWRCERKNECPARMHTKVNDLTILKRIHPHNHPEPSEAELSFYNLTPSSVIPGQAIAVNALSRSLFKCRRLSRLMNESPTEAGQNKPTENQAIIAQLNRPMVIKRESSEEAFSDENDSHLPPNAKRQKLLEVEQLIMATPNFHEVFELSKKLIQFISMLKNEKLTVYISFEEDSYVYKAIELENRTEKCFIEHLEKLTGVQCMSSNVQLIVSPKIHVVVHDSMVQSWNQGEYFKLKVLPQGPWKLEKVEV